jgi:sporulation protein YlmC with PRC-barrel domain
MKRKLQIIISASAASVLAFTSLAQETTSPKTYEPGSERQSQTQARVDLINDAVKSTDLIGMTVNNYQGEKIGTVEELVVDLRYGRLIQVILSTGSYSGSDGMMTAVSPETLHHDADNKILQLDTNKEKLKMAPTFEPGTWNQGAQSNRVAELYVYYGEHPYFISSRHDRWITNTDGTFTRTSPINEGRNNSAGTAIADGTHQTVQTTDHWTYMGDLQKASSLIGTPVNNLQGENLGNVQNLLVDLRTGRIVAVVISSGGFLGMGDVLSPVPPMALHLSTDQNDVRRDIATPDTTMALQNSGDQNDSGLPNSTAASPNTGTSNRYRAEQRILLLDASKKMLANAPHFKSNEWPDFGQPSYVGGVYRAYNVEPYYNASGLAAPVK